MGKGFWDLGTYQMFNVGIGSLLIHVAIVAFLRWYPIALDAAICSTVWLACLGGVFVVIGIKDWLL